MKVTRNMIDEAMTGLINVYYTDRKIAEETKRRHCRSGKINRDESKELAGVEVVAKGFDELGNVVALTKEGYLIQGTH